MPLIGYLLYLGPGPPLWTDYLPRTILLTLVVTVHLWILSALWVYCDARRRVGTPLAATLLVLFVCWPVSLIVWILARPKEIHIIRGDRRL